MLRIQATDFLLDWLGRRIGGSPFDFLRRPNTYQERQPRTEALSEAELDGLLWEAPRPLLRQVVPTLLRKLQAGWTYTNPQQAGALEDANARHSLSEYLPKATFAELDLAEARLDLRSSSGAQKEEFLSVPRALFEACPGRVSKRYATRVGEPGYWHPFSTRLVGGRVTAPVRDLFPERLGLGTVDGVRVYQIQAAALEHRPKNVIDSSNSSWDWTLSGASSFSRRRWSP